MLTLQRTGSSSISNELASQIDFDERVLWHDIPEQGFRVLPLQALIMVGVGVLSLPLLLGNIASLLLGENIDSWIPSDIFVLGLACNWFGVPILDMIRRKKTYYVLTQRRVLIASGILWRRVQSIEIKALPIVEFHPKADGRGSVMLGQAYRAVTGKGISSVINPPALDGIANAQEVYDTIQEIREGK